MDHKSSYFLQLFQEVSPCYKANQNVNDKGRANLAESLCASAVDESRVKINGASSTFQEFEDMGTVADETDGLSDIDDVEVNSYLNNGEETRNKKMIWEEMNKEYLQEQAAKEAAAAAVAAAYTDFNMDSDDKRAAKELAAVAESRQILIGPSDWEDHSLGMEGVARYKIHNLPNYASCVGVYELGIALSHTQSGKGLFDSVRKVPGLFTEIFSRNLPIVF